MKEDCLKEITCANCQQDHPAYERFGVVYKKKKKKKKKKEKEKN